MNDFHHDDKSSKIWPPPPSNSDADSGADEELDEERIGFLNRFFVVDIALGGVTGCVLFSLPMMAIFWILDRIHFDTVNPLMRHLFEFVFASLGPVVLFRRYWRRYPDFMLAMIFVAILLSLSVFISR